jgi:hypothetical protein
MAHQFPNKTAQVGVYKTGSPPYIDVSSEEQIVDECASFIDAATLYSFADGDTLGVLVRKNSSDWAVWVVAWDAANKYLLRVSEESIAGTLIDADSVTVYATLTTAMIQSASTTPNRMQPLVESGTSRLISANDSGKTICCTAATTVSLSLPDNLPANVHGLAVQEGLGEVRFTASGTSTINGGTSPVLLAGQYKSAYFYQRTQGAWVACV